MESLESDTDEKGLACLAYSQKYIRKMFVLYIEMVLMLKVKRI